MWISLDMVLESDLQDEKDSKRLGSKGDSTTRVAQEITKGWISGSESRSTRLKDDSASTSSLSGFNTKSGPLSHVLDLKVFAEIDLEVWSAGF